MEIIPSCVILPNQMEVYVCAIPIHGTLCKWPLKRLDIYAVLFYMSMECPIVCFGFCRDYCNLQCLVICKFTN